MAKKSNIYIKSGSALIPKDTLRVHNISSSARRNIGLGVLNTIVAFIIFVVVLRVIFSGGTYEIIPETIFLELLEMFGNQSWATQNLLECLSEFSKVWKWANDDSGILEALKSLIAIFGTIGVLVKLIFALLGCALQFIRFVFSLFLVGV